MAGTPLQIVVGLGNPGPEHRLTRHNAGFWFVDALAYRQGVQFRAHARYQGEIAKVVVEGVNLVYKHVKRGHPKSPQGGRLRMEMPISEVTWAV